MISKEPKAAGVDGALAAMVAAAMVVVVVATVAAAAMVAATGVAMEVVALC